MRSYIIWGFGLLLLFSLPFSVIAAESTLKVNKFKCTITRIDGPLIETSCKNFYFSEQTKIMDLTGQTLLPYQIPLPCPADLEVECPAQGNCSSAISIIILRRIKILPE